MRIVYAYGIISGGGCEKRMGDLVRWLTKRGDEAWIIGTCMNEFGRAQLYGQQRVPPERILLYAPESTEAGTSEAYAAFIADQSRELKADILDVQYPTVIVPPPSCKAVYTMHGTAQPIPDQIFDGILSVETNPRSPAAQYSRQLYAEVDNWVDTRRFRFRRRLGKGACFIGRTFKKVNALKVARHWRGTIDCYGIADIPGEQFPRGIRWQGYCDPAEMLPRYRVVFASAQVALEAIACGRLVIAGQHYVNAPGGELVLRDNIEWLVENQFYTHDKSGYGLEPTSGQVYAEFVRAMAKAFTWQRWQMARYVRKHHGMDRQIRKVRQFYEEVMAA